MQKILSLHLVNSYSCPKHIQLNFTALHINSVVEFALVLGSLMWKQFEKHLPNLYSRAQMVTIITICYWCIYCENILPLICKRKKKGESKYHYYFLILRDRKQMTPTWEYPKEKAKLRLKSSKVHSLYHPSQYDKLHQLFFFFFKFKFL